MTEQAYSKPVPVPQGESDYYWEKTKAHELWLRKCNDCNQAYFYPRDICPMCFSRNTSWIQASGKGTLHTFAIVHRAPTPAFRDDAPFVVAMGKPRLISRSFFVKPSSLDFEAEKP